jgi:hypothetical protein
MADALPPSDEIITDAELSEVAGGAPLPKCPIHSGETIPHQTYNSQCDGKGYYQIYCPHPDTPILVSSTGETRHAGDLEVGDWIYTRHQHRDEWAQYQVAQAEPRQQPCARVDFESGRTVVVSLSHRFLLAPAAEVHSPAAYDPAPMNGWIHISEHIAGVALLDAPHVQQWIRVSGMAVGTAIQGWDTIDIVARITPIGMGPVVQLEVDDAHTYVAGGLLSHNKAMFARACEPESHEDDGDAPAAP